MTTTFQTDTPTRTLCASYNYTDETGYLLFQVLRYQPKDFSQRRPDGSGGWINNLAGVRRVPYGLRELLQGVRDCRVIFITEGEKDAINLRTLGFTVTCFAGGAGRVGETAAFRNASAVILPHNDETGRDGAEKVAKALSGVARRLRVVNLPGLGEKGDVTDWMNAGGTRADLIDLVRFAPNYQPPPKSSGATLPNGTKPTSRLVRRATHSLPFMLPVEHILHRMTGRYGEFYSQFAELHPAHGQLRGACPIHNGYRPNFTINEETGQFYCHSDCRDGGDVFTFLMRLKNITFKEALAEVADFAG